MNSQLTPETIEAFPKAFEEKLGPLYQRALKMAHGYGQMMFEQVANTLLYAIDQGKVEEVLQVLEGHYKEHLRCKPIAVRGVTTGDHNREAQMFFDILFEPLGFKLRWVEGQFELCSPGAGGPVGKLRPVSS